MTSREYQRQLTRFFRYCPRCGKRFTRSPKHGTRELHCTRCGFTFYRNSKPTAGVILIKGNKILLSRRAITPYHEWWDTPGGFLKLHEKPELGARREIREELGVRLGRLRLLGLYLGWYPGRPPQSTISVIYVARSWTGKPKPADDVSEVRWFDIRKLPARIAFRSNHEALRDLQKVLRGRL